MATEQDERLQDEFSLLDAMYPGQVATDLKTRAVKYSSSESSFHLRLPDGYPDTQLPEVLTASIGRSDVRQQVMQHVQSCNVGEEILDSIVLAFTELAEASADSATVGSNRANSSPSRDLSKATVIVWLHHLLNTNKRKMALSPQSAKVSGLTKPGYPGVLLYTGPAEAVHEHVNELKHQNWQAFQIRFESDEEWVFAHGPGVKEVEAMKEVVAEIGEERKALFMEAMRMK